MGLDLYLNFLWLVPFTAWFATRNKSQLVRGTITGVSFGLVISYVSAGLYALYYAWPASEVFGQIGFYLNFIHDLAGVRVAIILQLISAESPITDDQKFLIAVVNTVFWGITYGLLGFLWGYFRIKYLTHCGL
ncbi:hypothetical protein L4D76_06365 [Photobacterium sagamiensis]|uniref:hypothetical protein n=1 Tax=Photobacterium sagamiensis TaxID=2910241 RepID=UPI003D0E069E